MKRTQYGVSLVSVAIAVLVAGFLTVAGLRALAALQEENTAQNLANGLFISDKALASYVTKYYSQLINHQPVCAPGGSPCVVNTLAPTPTDFKNLGILPLNFQTIAYTGGSWKFQVSLTPAGCTPTTCNVSWMSYLDTPPRNANGHLDLSVVGDAAVRSGLTAGYSTPANPATLYGLRGAWNAPNPLGSVPGVLAAVGSFDSSAFSSYLPRSGALPMTGDLDVGGHAVQNASGYAVVGGGGLNEDQGGSVELGGSNTTAGTGTPYVDFHLAGQGVQDYNVRLQNQTPNTLTVEGANNYGSLDVQGSVTSDQTFASQVHAMGTSNASLPPGWGGGVTSWDVHADATVGTGPPGQTSQAYMNSAAAGPLGSGGLVAVQSPNGAQSAYMAASNSGPVLAAGATRVTSQGVTLPPVANQGWGCSPNGSVAANANGSGQLMTCVNGAWQATGGTSGPDFSNPITVGVGGQGQNLVNVNNIGPYKYCAIQRWSYDTGWGSIVSVDVYPSAWLGNGEFYWGVYANTATRWGPIYLTCYN